MAKVTPPYRATQSPQKNAQRRLVAVHLYKYQKPQTVQRYMTFPCDKWYFEKMYLKHLSPRTIFYGVEAHKETYQESLLHKPEGQLLEKTTAMEWLSKRGETTPRLDGAWLDFCTFPGPKRTIERTLELLGRNLRTHTETPFAVTIMHGRSATLSGLSPKEKARYLGNCVASGQPWLMDEYFVHRGNDSSFVTVLGVLPKGRA